MVRNQIAENKYLATVQKGGRITINKDIRDDLSLDEDDILLLIEGGSKRKKKCPNCEEKVTMENNGQNILEIKKVELKESDELVVE